MFNENYGEITPSLNRTLKRCNVPPAYYWTLEDAYLSREREPDHAQIERFIKKHSGPGGYDEPWPFSDSEVLTA